MSLRWSLALLLVLLSGCGGAPVREVTQGHAEHVSDIDEAGLWSVSNKIEAQLKAAPQRIRDPSLQKYIDDLTCKLAAEICADVRVYLVNDVQFNAFMMANGAMVLYSGMLLRMEDEAQLATVIAHEIAHYRKRHSLIAWRRAKSTSGWTTLVALASGGSAVGLVATLGAYANFAAFSRTQEREADEVSFQTLASSGYAAPAPSEIWRNLNAEYQLEPKPLFAGVFASHPLPPTRQSYLEQLAQQPSAKGQERHIDRFAAAVSPLRTQWLDNELARRRYEQSAFLFDRLSKLRFGNLQTSLAKAELFRKRDHSGDLERAIVLYKAATQRAEAPPQAFRDFGLTLRKAGKNAEALAAFKQYLQRLPEANDAAMIRSYIDAN